MTRQGAGDDAYNSPRRNLGVLWIAKRVSVFGFVSPWHDVVTAA